MPLSFIPKTRQRGAMQLSFSTLPGTYAITRLPADAALPDWFDGPGLCSATRGVDELSLVCAADRVPTELETEAGWTALRVDTLAQLDEAGVVMAAVTPISSAGYGVFVLSTHLRDYLLVRHDHLSDIAELLRTEGHSVA
ncbi:MAG: ACT domain-containing protein [Pseudomonadota bacterium]